MYEKHWKLRAKPFENDLDIAYFFRSREHREALIRLLYTILESKGAVLLTSDPGCGKTYLLHMLAKELEDKRARVAMIKNAASEPLDLLRQITQAFGVRSVTESKSDLVAGLEQVLAYHRESGARAVLIIDDVDLIRDERAFDELRLLMNLELGGRPLLTLVLSGQTRLKAIIREMPGLAQRVALSCTLPALGREDALRYVAHRLRKADGRGDVFDDDALQEIYRGSRGVPRLINHLCDLALLLAASEGVSTIDSQVVARARNEFKEIHN